MNFEELLDKARSVVNPRRLTESVEVGGVGAALVTPSGRVFTGVCIDTDCSLGFCAEHAAVAAMVTAGEDRIEKIVAVDWDGSVLSPCGRCRELISQFQVEGEKTLVMVKGGDILPIDELLPFDWRSSDTRS